MPLFWQYRLKSNCIVETYVQNGTKIQIRKLHPCLRGKSITGDICQEILSYHYPIKLASIKINFDLPEGSLPYFYKETSSSNKRKQRNFDKFN